MAEQQRKLDDEKLAQMARNRTNRMANQAQQMYAIVKDIMDNAVNPADAYITLKQFEQMGDIVHFVEKEPESND